ncbi:aerobic respiration two-component sensor histidine kinase ArcB [Gallaecimonas sp. GXIMD4217]|uniref:aerobic respiration two-component sensor histidine kinase ArcB n=1 Tax=Gallaecimonas sp. GXIMD4217 TaxID=3131927 RepID=UPI00311AC23D
MMKIWAQTFIEILTRLGTVRFSIALVSLILMLSLIGNSTTRILLHGTVTVLDIFTPILLTLLTAPWILYFFLEMISQLDKSRQELRQLVEQLEQMRAQDKVLNESLKDKVDQLNFEIEERKKAEQARQEAIDRLSLEVVERKKTQESLAEQTALLRSFINSSPDMIYFRNEKGIFYGCNRAVEEVTGKSEQELIGLSPFEVYPDEVALMAIETDKHVFETNQHITYEQWLEYPDGRKALFEMRKVPFFSASGKRLGLLGFGRDITERKKAADALEKAAREKTQFIATISHELRTPLNGVVGLARMLRDTELTEEQRSFVNTIYVSSVTLGNIFNDIIDMDKMDRRRLAIVPERVNFPEFLADLQNLAELLAGQKGLDCVFSIDGELPEQVHIDGTRTRQVLWNLLGNAVKFTDQGRVGIRVQLSPGEQGQIEARFEVFDTGIGIPKAEQDKIFAMYYQTEGGGRKHATGTGIGLAVSRTLVEAMGGSLAVSSEPGQGSVFTLCLSLPPADGQEPEPQEQESPSLDILLVEDIELNVTVARSLLEKLGHRVTVAMTGQAALDAVAAQAFDLVLLDIQLPDMTGFDVAIALRERDDCQELPIVALTANVISDKDEYLENGMDDAISKPLSVESLRLIVDEFFGGPGGGYQLVPDNGEDPEQDQLLDVEMLSQYLEAVGPDILLQSARLFREQMPEYMSILESNLTAEDVKGTSCEAHKIKGAAGAIGLKRIQQLANQAQHSELPAWAENIQDWVEEIGQNWRADLDYLEQWLRQQ